MNEDFEHTKRTWNHFKCVSLGEYSGLYLKMYVLLLADVFKHFRDICILNYDLDSAFYFMTPGFSFDGVLKYVEMKFNLIIYTNNNK